MRDSYAIEALQAIGLNGGDDELNLLRSRVDALNKKMVDIVSESVKSGCSIEDCEAECKEIGEQIKLLKSRITAIETARNGHNNYREKMKLIEQEINDRRTSGDVYNDTVVRQMVECIKVFSGGRIEVYFGGGYMIEEQI